MSEQMPAEAKSFGGIMSDREELLKVFWEAADSTEFVRIPEFEGYVYDYSAQNKEGEDVCVDGFFNIWAGIQAVITASKKRNHD